VDAGEPELVRRLRRAELSAIGELYDRLHEDVRAFARRLLGDAAAAEDLVQETFLAVPAAIRGFRSEASLRSFVIGVAANHARHHVRAATRRRAAHARSEEAPAPASTPEDRVQRRQLAEALTRALDALPFEQRVAIVLCEVEERTCAEAAVIVGAPEATIRTRIFHGKRRLREALAAMGIT
jgi:RNA polymerase sigma-70 factor (ECF subfamily)